MRIRTRAVWLVGTLGIPLGALGCELALDFDRSRVDGGALVGIDATFSDAPPRVDVVAPGDGPLDAPAGEDAQPEAGEASSDAGADALVDTGADAADSADALGMDATDG